jgi:hypothetical protein
LPRSTHSKASSDFLHDKFGRALFAETPLAGLGYSINHNGGKGIGNKLASNLTETIIEIVRLGIIDPAIFEMAGFFEPGIGADRISDMIIHILLSNIALFSSRIARSLGSPEFRVIRKTYPREKVYAIRLNSKHFKKLR